MVHCKMCAQRSTQSRAETHLATGTRQEAMQSQLTRVRSLVVNDRLALIRSHLEPLVARTLASKEHAESSNTVRSLWSVWSQHQL